MPRKKKEPEAAPVVETIPEPVVEPVAQSRRKGGRPTKAKPIESPSPELEVSPVIDLAPEPEPEKKPRKKRGRASEAEPVETIQEYFGRLFGKPVKSAEASQEQEEPAVSPVVSEATEPEAAPVVDEKPARKRGRPAKTKPPVEPVPDTELVRELVLEPQELPELILDSELEAPSAEPVEVLPEPEPVAVPEPESEPKAEPEPVPEGEAEAVPVAPLKSTDRFQSPEFPDRRMKPNPLFIETKSKRVQLLLQPSLYEKMKSLAEMNNKSFNEYVHVIFESFLREQEQEKKQD